MIETKNTSGSSGKMNTVERIIALVAGVVTIIGLYTTFFCRKSQISAFILFLHQVQLTL